MNAKDQPASKAAKLQVGLMVLILVATILAGFMLMPETQEQRDQLIARLGTTNQGQLISPTLPLDKLALTDGDGNPWDWRQQDRKWRILLPGDSACRDQCRDMVYLTRQVHMLQAKNVRRIERVYINLDDELNPKTANYFEQEHPYLEVLHADSREFEQWLAGADSGWQPGIMRAILVDPRGEAMMLYTPDHTGDQMDEDLRHLLRYSPD